MKEPDKKGEKAASCQKAVSEHVKEPVKKAVSEHGERTCQESGVRARQKRESGVKTVKEPVRESGVGAR